MKIVKNKEYLDRKFCESFLRGAYNFATSEESSSGSSNEQTSSSTATTRQEKGVNAEANRSSGSSDIHVPEPLPEFKVPNLSWNQYFNDNHKKLFGIDQHPSYLDLKGKGIFIDEGGSTSTAVSVPRDGKGITLNNKPLRSVLKVPGNSYSELSGGIVSTIGSVGDVLSSDKDKTSTETSTGTAPTGGTPSPKFSQEEASGGNKMPRDIRLTDAELSEIEKNVNEFNEKVNEENAKYEKTDKGEEATKQHNAALEALKKEFSLYLAKHKARNTIGNMVYNMVPAKGETWSQAWDRLTPEQKWSIGIGGGVSSLLGLSMLTKKKKDISDYLMAGLFPVAGVAAGALGGSALSANPNTYNVNVYNQAYRRYNPTPTPQPATSTN